MAEAKFYCDICDKEFNTPGYNDKEHISCCPFCGNTNYVYTDDYFGEDN